MPREYDEKTAKAVVTRNGGTVKGKQITIKRAGIKVWGAIDYLCSKCKYTYFTEGEDA